MLDLRGYLGARSVLAHHRAHDLALDDPGCLLDVDTPALLARAQACADAQAEGGARPHAQP